MRRTITDNNTTINKYFSNEKNFKLHYSAISRSENDVIIIELHFDRLLAHADDAMDVDKPSGNTLGSGSSAPPPGSEGKAFHEGFLCDGCKGPIYGIRYRCTKCGNYDLCELCEKKGKR
jgi:hypothetical protein